MEERQDQVAMMSDIYRQATRVITYMGPESNNSTVAIAAMERYCEWWNNNGASSGAQMESFSHEETVAIQKLLSRGWVSLCTCQQLFLHLIFLVHPLLVRA
jgi:hypothetical protein